MADNDAARRGPIARGWGGQRIVVFPELDMVVVFTGGNYETGEPVVMIIEQHILPAWDSDLPAAGARGERSPAHRLPSYLHASTGPAVLLHPGSGPCPTRR